MTYEDLRADRTRLLGLSALAVVVDASCVRAG